LEIDDEPERILDEMNDLEARVAGTASTSRDEVLLKLRMLTALGGLDGDCARLLDSAIQDLMVA
jgi:hypothetical protein